MSEADAELQAEESDRLLRLIGACEPMQQVFDLVRKVAPTDASLLIQGESGTGKELVAQAVHALSPRKDESFVAINTAAIPETLLEAELFGYRKGAFTGADRDKRGLFVEADGGTIFLDEISSMGRPFQAKLLRVLQEGELTPVGDTVPVNVDVRVLCASNADLQKAVERSEFREDLYYRLNVIQIDLPPLRDRGEDVILLARAFAEEWAENSDKDAPTLADEAIAHLRSHPWPGNVRELRNTIERACVFADDGVITPDAMQPPGTGGDGPAPLGDVDLLTTPLEEAESEVVRRFRRRYLRALVRRHEDDLDAAAEAAGMDRKDLDAALEDADVRPGG